ncbi:hypothetical protein Rs2_50747 [Raphanus sativus]|uniref:Uncharacterized protein LOC130505761 n=1 Tax=Raphanus sativus TaxID=3726 RepID=A0A9W3CXX8_RAPSA|nr:uncharacterized protein LOC130505761 [Raphanus sativus]KAJ4867709.1 hypothetical protein Rs2_50747 [Raphanus sativus]
MSLLLNHPLKLCFRRPVLVRSSPLVSTSLPQTAPCTIVRVGSWGLNEAKLGVIYADQYNQPHGIDLHKVVPRDLVYDTDDSVTIGSSHGWVATLKKDGILRLQDDLNPSASYTNPKRIPLPPLVTLPHCQTQIVTNVSMSTSSPEDEDCVVAVKFLGPQISFCRPAQRNSEWTNIRIENPCFFSSRVMFSKKDEMFLMPGSGGHLIASWDLLLKKNTKLQNLCLDNLPKLSKKKRELLEACCKSEHLVESRSTGETFLIKWYKKTTKIFKGVARMKTKALMVFKLDGLGNAVYTKDIGDLAIFLSKSEPFCVNASSFPDLAPNRVHLNDMGELAIVCPTHISPLISLRTGESIVPPFYIPPQNIELS